MRRMFSSKAMNYKNGEVVINNAMVVEDNGDATIGKDLAVDGKIIVNSANDVVDINGQPIVGGLYIHDGYMEDQDGNDYDFRVLSKVPTAFTSIRQLQNESFFASYFEGDDTVIGVYDTGDNSYRIRVLAGEYYDFTPDELTLHDDVK